MIKSSQKGFTLVEVMISIGLFTVIMIIGITAVLGVNNTYRKTRSMRSAIDNLSFIMEDMARNIRLGTNYRCLNDIQDLDFSVIEDAEDGVNCVGIAFEPFWSPVTGDQGDQVVYFISDSGGFGSIFKSLEGSNDPANNLLPMNSVDVDIDITKSSFAIYGTDNLDGEQPAVFIKINGTARSGQAETNFNLQTTVSQRFIDFPPQI